MRRDFLKKLGGIGAVLMPAAVVIVSNTEGNSVIPLPSSECEHRIWKWATDALGRCQSVNGLHSVFCADCEDTMESHVFGACYICEYKKG